MLTEERFVKARMLASAVMLNPMTHRLLCMERLRNGGLEARHNAGHV